MLQLNAEYLKEQEERIKREKLEREELIKAGKDPDKKKRNVKKRIKGVLGKDPDKKRRNVKMRVLRVCKDPEKRGGIQEENQVCVKLGHRTLKYFELF